MSLYDGLAITVRRFLEIVLPFMAGYYFFRKSEDFTQLLIAVFFAGLVYSVLMLYEVRFSPQLHSTFYGYFPHSFAQQVRGGGFRPVVFLQHGLWVAFFAMMMTIAAFSLWRHNKQEPAVGSVVSPYFLPIALYFVIVLVFCRSLGSLIYALFLIPVVVVLPPRMQVYMGAALCAIALFYPLLRVLELFPKQEIVYLANFIDQERAQSLNFRFTNDQLMMERALDRPFFGWGSWGRGLIYHGEFSRKTVVVDGYWIGILAQSGLAGFVGLFALLGWPLLRYARLMMKRTVEPTAVVAGCFLLAAINMIELLPNSTLPQVSWLIAGGFLAMTQQAHPKSGDAAASKPLPERRQRRTVL